MNRSVYRSAIRSAFRRSSSLIAVAVVAGTGLAACQTTAPTDAAMMPAAVIPALPEEVEVATREAPVAEEVQNGVTVMRGPVGQSAPLAASGGAPQAGTSYQPSYNTAAADAAAAPPMPTVVRGDAVGGSLLAAIQAQESQAVEVNTPGGIGNADLLLAEGATGVVPVTDLAPAARGPDAVPELAVAEMVFSGPLPAPTTVESLQSRGAVPMALEEIEAITDRNTVVHTNVDNGFRVATYYDGQGFSYLLSQGRGYPGRYQVSEGARCRIDSQGVGVCASLYREGQTIWICDDRDNGQCNWIVSEVLSGRVPTAVQ